MKLNYDHLIKYEDKIKLEVDHFTFETAKQKHVLNPVLFFISPFSFLLINLYFEQAPPHRSLSVPPNWHLLVQSQQRKSQKSV